MILAGDVGGTKTHLGIFSSDPKDAHPLARATYGSREGGGLEPMVRRFFSELGVGDGPSGRIDPRSIRFACFGIAGPVRNRRVDTTNLPWDVDAAALERALGFSEVALLNDLEANAYGLPLLQPEQIAVLQEGTVTTGNQGVLSAGTGLGEAGLYWDGIEHRPFASEGGHTDFAPRNQTEDELLAWLRARYAEVNRGRVSYERVVEIDTKNLGPDHPDVADDLESLAEVLHAMGDDSGARRAEARVTEIRATIAAKGPPAD